MDRVSEIVHVGLKLDTQLSPRRTIELLQALDGLLSAESGICAVVAKFGKIEGRDEQRVAAVVGVVASGFAEAHGMTVDSLQFDSWLQSV